MRYLLTGPSGTSNDGVSLFRYGSRMVHEERRLTFTKDAVTAALRFWLDGGQLKLPPGHIVGVEPTPDGGCRLRM